MNKGRRQVLAGLGAALVAGVGAYAGRRSMLDRRPRVVEPGSHEPERTLPSSSTVELAPVQVRLGRRREPEAAHGPLAFDRRAPFGQIRETLRALGPVTAALTVEVHSRHDEPYLAGLPILLDPGPVPGMVAQDAEARAASHAREVMPLPRTYTGIHVSRDGLILDSVGELDILTLPPDLGESGWSGSMWILAQRGNVSRLHQRRPWIFVDDDVPWATVVQVIEATAPLECQPYRDRGCSSPWASLFVGVSAGD